MSSFIDLRKYNIRTEQDVMEFLELFISKAPQMVAYIKNQRLKNSSLQNRLEHALKQIPSQAVATGDENASVMDRMSGKTSVPTQSPAQTRLEQLKAARNVPVAPPAAPEPSAEDVEGDDLPPAPVAPGEIGQLNVPTIDPKAPDTAEAGTAPEIDLGDPNDSSVTLGDTPTGNTTTINTGATGSTPDSSTPTEDTVTGTEVSEEDAVAAAGSKSEHAADDGVQPEDTPQIDDNPPGEPTELTEEEKASLLAGPAQPTEDDTTSIADKAARAQKKRKKNRNK